jgi:uncharacterized membrane protein
VVGLVMLRILLYARHHWGVTGLVVANGLISVGFSGVFAWRLTEGVYSFRPLSWQTSAAIGVAIVVVLNLITLMIMAFQRRRRNRKASMERADEVDTTVKS